MTLRLNGDSSGFTEIKAADAAGDNSIKLPASNGSANQLLKNGSTAGELEYASDVYASGSRLLVGTPTPRITGTVNWNAQIEGVGFTGLSIVDNDAGNSGAYLHLAASNAGSVGGNTALVSGYGMGTIIFSGADGTDVNTQGAYIGAIVDGAVGTDVMPTKLFFSTNPGGAAPLKRLEIAPNGALKLFNSPGIDFSGIQTNLSGMTSETLDSYEEGTFSPTLTTINGSGSLSWNSTTGYYVKVGNVCTATFYSSTMTITNNGSGHALITGLPFASANLSNHYPVVNFTHVNAFQNNVLSGFVSTNTGNIYPVAYGDITQVNWTTGTPVYLMFSVTYRTN